MYDLGLTRRYWNASIRQSPQYLPIPFPSFFQSRSFTSTSSKNWLPPTHKEKDLPNYYYILDVGPEATKKEIKQSYLRLAKKYHPDLNKEDNAEELFRSLKEAYDVLSNTNEKAFYDQIKNINPNEHESGIPMPAGYHLHPAYVDRKKYDSTSRRGFYGVLDVLFSRRGMYLFLSAPVLMMFYLGASSLSPTKSQIHEQSLRSGWLDDTQVNYANVDTDGNSIDQGMELIPAYWHHKKKIWLRPNTYTNILKIGAGRQLTMVREYKTREGWKVPEGYVGPESERELQELAAKRADLLGIPRKLTDSEKETIVLARLKERNTKRKEKIEKRLKIQKKQRKIQKKKELILKERKTKRKWGLQPPGSQKA